MALLRQRSRTVNELAEALELTDNAIRAHLTSLERDGLVKAVGTEPGVRKPNIAYGLTDEAEQLFPRAYGAVLAALLKALSESLTPEELGRSLREAGRRMAQAHLPSVGLGIRERLDLAAGVLLEMGGAAEIKEEAGRFTLRGTRCPLKDAVAAHPDACSLAESLLAEIVGATVRERCQKGEDPRCCFEIDFSS